MSVAPPPRPVLFRVAGGHRLGFGHIVRAMSLAKALGVPAWLSVRGRDNARRVARQLGAQLEERSFEETLTAAEQTGELTLVVIDDPNRHTARLALAAARRHRRAHHVAVASVHDLGIAPIASDLAIDGSIVSLRRHWPATQALLGSRYAVLDAEIARLRAYRAARVDTASTHPTPAMPFIDEQPRIVISLGGGRRAGLSWRIGKEIALACPDVQVIVAAGFGSGARAARARKEMGACTMRNLRPLRAPEELRLEIARATIAIVAGGVTLYEAAALGVPAVAVAVVPAQRPTIAGFVRVGAASAAGDASADAAGVITRVMRRVTRLLDDTRARERMTLAARAAVDGQGSQRVGLALQRLMAVPARPERDERAPRPAPDEQRPDEQKPLGPTQVTA
jgi:spore coat polysaccharide biosynthesis predicted glycosyltransferase SpsG